jgi:feruloyl esterase
MTKAIWIMARTVVATGSLAAAAVFTSAPAGAGQLPASAMTALTRSCEALTSLRLDETTITSAQVVAAGQFTPPPGGGRLDARALPSFCRVAAVTRPAIKFEVWLPLDTWNGKFQGVGNGANAGSIGYGAMATALKRGYAAASTDTGHETQNARDGAWAIGHPELLEDFAYRAIHVMTDNGKKIVGQFYSQPAKYSYFVACSTGGRQALMEAQRFPNDYDGIIAGAPAINWTQFQAGGHMYVASLFNRDPESYLPATKLKALGAAVNASCDQLDGIKDGILADPRKCTFDAKALQCEAGKDDVSCLTPKQVTAVNAVWAGSHTAKGELIYPGYTRGAEAAPGGWNNYVTGTGPLSGTHLVQGSGTLGYLVYQDPKWDYRSFDVEKDAAFAAKTLGKSFDAFDPDLSPFRNHGGRLLLYHGWNDPSISPLNTVNYYGKVVEAVGKRDGAQNAEARTQEFARLFMVPGMLHCGNGPGPNDFDMVAALEKWVEGKEAPERIIASHETNGTVDRTRPLCVYPKVASYSGSGSTDDAANFVCKAP